MINENIKGVRICDKAFLTLKEASEYFNIGQDKVRQLTDEGDCNLSIMDKNKSNSNDILLVPHLSNHIFRHTFTTRLNEQNINTKAIQSILGHSDISTTMDIYVDATEDFKIEQMGEFEKAMKFIF